MIKIEPYDDLDDLVCKWYVEGYGLVFERYLVETLRFYARQLQNTGKE
jgi:hypothetical protein